MYAIPGSIHSPGARGCHQLIRDGATLIETVGDILESLQGWQLTAPAQQPAVQKILAFEPESEREPEHPLLELLKTQPLDIDQLVELSELPLHEVLATLTDFEINGNVSREGGFWLYRKA